MAIHIDASKRLETFLELFMLAQLWYGTIDLDNNVCFVTCVTALSIWHNVGIKNLSNFLWFDELANDKQANLELYLDVTCSRF